MGLLTTLQTQQVGALIEFQLISETANPNAPVPPKPDAV